MSKRRHFGNVRKLPSGRWQAGYWHKGQRHTAPETFKEKRDALAWLSLVEADIHRGAWIDPGGARMTVEEVTARWLRANVSKRPSSRERDEATLDAHVLPAIGKKPIGGVNRADVQSLVDSWAVRLAPSTVARMYSTLRALFNYAESAELIGRTPCRKIRVPHVGAVDRPVLTPEQLDRLATHLGPDQASIMWLGVVLGLRWAEIAGLRVADLDLLNGSVTVAVQRDRRGRLVPPKSAAGRRAMAAPVWLVEELAAHLARRGLTGADGDALVFVAPTGGGLRYDNWRCRVWKPACKAAGLDGLRLHDLRSMAATALVVSNVDVKTAQARLGHSSPTLTLQVYARATEQADRAAADALDKFFGASRTNRARRPAEPEKRTPRKAL
jgi:integrase